MSEDAPKVASMVRLKLSGWESGPDRASPEGSPEPSKTPSKLMVCRWFQADEPGFQSAILTEKMLKNQLLTERFRTLPEKSLVPEEHSYWAFKHLIFRAKSAVENHRHHQ